MQLDGHLSISKKRSNGAFTLLEAVTASALLAIFAIGAAATYSTMNSVAGRTRTAVVAQTVLRNYVDEAMAAVYNTSTPPSILVVTSDTAAGATDEDGDGEKDGVRWPNATTEIPLLVTRDSKTGNVQNNLVTAQVFRHCKVVDSSLNLLRVTFLVKYTERGKTYYQKLSVLKAGEN